MAEYERNLAKQWQTVSSRAQTQSDAPAKLIPRFGYIADTVARDAWRRREPPAERFVLPADFVPPPPRSNAPRSLSRNASGGRSPPMAVPETTDIALETNTEIEFGPQVGGHRRGQMEVLIWGDARNARSALERLQLWVKSYETDKASSGKWEKVQNVSGNLRAAFEKKLKDRLEADRYRRDPDPNAADFDAYATFDWPRDFHPPDVILGRNLEACDPIRTQQKCWVSLDPDACAIKVRGFHTDLVKKAMIRLRGCYFQAVARERGNQVQRKLLLCGVSRIPAQTQIKLEDYPKDRPSGDTLGKKPRLVDFSYPGTESRIQKDDVAAVEKAASRATASLQYYRAHLKMQARFGTFVLRKYLDTVGTLAELTEMLGDEHCEADIYDSDMSKAKNILLQRLSTCPRLMTPGDNSFDRPETLRVTPSVSVTFLLAMELGSNDFTHYKLDMKWERDDRQQWNIATKAWSRLGLNLNKPEKILDVCLVDLDDAATGWNLEIKAADVDMAADRRGIDSVFADFADQVKLDEVALQRDRGSARCIDYKPVGGLIMKQLMQKMTWTFEYGHTGYMCNITHRKPLTLRHPNSTRPDQSQLREEPDQVDLNITSPNWDSHLADNSIIGLGEPRQTAIDVKTLFPDASGGVRGFLDILNDVWSIILGQ